MPRYPDVNGAQTSYCSIAIGLGAARIAGVKSINYKDTGEIAKMYGTSGVPIGRTRGRSDCEGDIELYQADWDELLPILTAGGILGYMELAWPVTVTYAEPSNLAKTRTDALVGVRFHSADRANSEGTDPLTVKLSMSIMNIKWHGVHVALRSYFV